MKPNSSRPANAERYLICSTLKKGTLFKRIRSHLWVIVKKLWEFKGDSEHDVLEIIPLDIIKRDENFYGYIIENNNR